MRRDIQVMAQIQAQKKRDIDKEQRQALNGEGAKLAGGKRETFDIPVNAVKVDPLR